MTNEVCYIMRHMRNFSNLFKNLLSLCLLTILQGNGMRYTISQKDFQKKVNYTKGNFTRDFLKKYDFPMEGKNLVMPDAEELYHKVAGGIPPVKIEVFEPSETLSINLSGDATMQDLLNAKVKKENALGNLHDTNLKKIKGELLSVEEVSVQVVAGVTIVRNNFISLPNKIAPQLEGLSAAEIQLKLEDAVNDILTDIYSLRDKYLVGSENEQSAECLS